MDSEIMYLVYEFYANELRNYVIVHSLIYLYLCHVRDVE